MRAGVVIALVLFSGIATAQPAPAPPDWKAWRPLIGTWIADKTSGGAVAGFTLRESLQGRVLVRESYSEHPAANAQPTSRQEDMILIYQDGPTTRADYWDSDGNHIHYTVLAADRFLFVTESRPHDPRYRLIYTLTSPSTLQVELSIAPPGTDKFRASATAQLHKRQ